jgi:hypothetical protein
LPSTPPRSNNHQATVQSNLTSDPINIEDAKVPKGMGLPLNMPVEHRQFARESSKHSFALWKWRAELLPRVASK